MRPRSIDRTGRGARPTTAITQLPSPYTGWNTRDAITAMEPTDAVALENWFPGDNGVTLRNGSQSFADGLGAGAVQTLAEFYTGTKRQLLGACSGAIYNASAGGTVGAALKSGLTSDKWQTVNFKSIQQWVNGADTPQTYDGSSFADSGWSGSGLTPSNLIGVCAFKERLYFIEKDTPNFWYGASGAITSTLTKFPLSMVGTFGGNLIAIVPVSYTGGASIQDLLAFIMTSGDAFVYQGDDPGGGLDHWSLVNHYKFGAPLGLRAVAQYGGDAYITTADDYVSASVWIAALRAGKVPTRTKATGAVNAAAIANGSLFGWQTLNYPRGRMIIFNVPQSDGSFQQHILNTSEPGGAWCLFTGMNASCWGLFEDNLYFGTNSGEIWQADTGSSDGGTAIQGDCQQAWNSFGSPYRKRLVGVRPIIQSTGNVTYTFGVGADYQDAIVSVADESTPGGSYWDVSTWDIALWSPESGIDIQWRINGNWGAALSPRLRVAGLQPIAFLRTDLRMERGNAL